METVSEFWRRFLILSGKTIVLKFRKRMNKILPLLLLVIAQLADSCMNNSNNINNELKEWKLQGSVKSLSETDYSKNGKFKAWLLLSPEGNILEQSTFNSDGSLIRKWKYTYNSTNQKVTRSCYVVKDSLSGILYYTYNQNGKIINEKLLNTSGKLVSEIDYKYDAMQNEVEKIFKDEKDKIQIVVKSKFDQKNKLIEELQLDSTNHQNGKNRYTYNTEGLNVETTSLSIQDNPVKRITYTFLDTKQVGEVRSYNSENQLTTKTIYNYDKQGNMTLKQSFTPLGEMEAKLSFTYTYDKNNNWTMRYEYLNDKVDDVISRKFEYYK